jgi:hypothetical protein
VKNERPERQSLRPSGGDVFSGKGRWRGDYGRGDSERKFKYRTADGCEVERKWKKGEYEEKVKCKPRRYGYGY